MICQRPNPGSTEGDPPLHWAATTDEAGKVFGVICPACITGELLSITAGGNFSARQGLQESRSGR